MSERLARAAVRVLVVALDDTHPARYLARGVIGLAVVAAAMLSCACVSAPNRMCGRLRTEDIGAFHQSHALSRTANQSSVLELAAENWAVCVDVDGGAAIQNRPSLADEDIAEWCKTYHVDAVGDRRALCINTVEPLDGGGR